MASEPLVSIYIPTKNRADLLDRALASIYTQTYKHIEVLVCDDGSDIDISHVKRKYERKFSDLKWIRNERSMGASGSRNRMIEVAKGEFITGLDDDDQFLPTRVDEFVHHPWLANYSFLATPILAYNGKMLYKSMRCSGVITLEKLLGGNVIGNQVFTRTEYLRAIGGFDPTFPSWQDYDTWLRLVEKFGPGYKSKAPTYRLNLDHELGRITTSGKAYQGYLMFIAKHDNLLRKDHRSMLYFRDLINRNASAEDRDQFISSISLASFPLLLKYLAKRSRSVASAWR